MLDMVWWLEKFMKQFHMHIVNFWKIKLSLIQKNETELKNDFEKNFFLLLVNFTFAKMMEDVCNWSKKDLIKT